MDSKYLIRRIEEELKNQKEEVEHYAAILFRAESNVEKLAFKLEEAKRTARETAKEAS